MSIFSMTKIILKSLFNKPATTRYPFVPIKRHPKMRGALEIEISSCIFCGLCQKKCLTAALIVDRNQKTWEIDRLSCISCGNCVEVCPKKCLKLLSSYTPPVYKKEKEIYRNV
ncbi:ech hydrogenase subunit F [Candidatus Omnitrophus magneticus]|uniref:Ech hydrogenase subunit F n=1 Tax=Candidatus Omnitrophus magneticus TaxID=1609969 RepID=A0A0F0CVA8_9BACT|nr:ech hydrogenase subunit F [Candidatus Omnitrophus magneticus]